MEELLAEQRKLQAEGGYSKALNEVDKTLDLLQKARDAITADPSSAAIQLAKLQTPVQQSYENMNTCLKKVNKAQSGWNKALNKRFDPKKTAAGGMGEVKSDPLAGQEELIDRAVAMHFLREGEFGVASTFIQESQRQYSSQSGQITRQNGVSLNGRTAPAVRPPTRTWQEEFLPKVDGWARDGFTLPNEGLQEHFAEMYHILHELRTNRNLAPAIAWAHKHAELLETRGSNLEFELCRLQFIMLFTEPTNSIDMDLDDSVEALERANADLQERTLKASAYAREAFPRFGPRYMRSIQQLSCGLLYGANFATSPYASLFANTSAWEDVASSFTREFCSLLGLSADSPLFVACTAGAIALPRIRKYAELQARNKVEWTSVGELPVEIPLPPAYYFHPIFVCPVSREQATDSNPPMMMPCGHVILQESLANTSKGARFKCPYCPGESHPREARRVYLA